MESPYARVDDIQLRVPMIRPLDRQTVSEDLSQSLFWGFENVLNAREHKIDPDAIPPEPEAPSSGADVPDAFFWSANPNHSLLLINDLKHKGQVYIDDVTSNSISWDKLFRRFLAASFLLPIYIVYSFRGPQVLDAEHRVVVPRPSRVYQASVFVIGTIYWFLLFGSSLLFFIVRPKDVSVTEILLPLALHFFCFFVEALLCSVEVSSVESFDDAADRMMCRMQVTGTSYSWSHTRGVDAAFLPPELRASSNGAEYPDSDEEDENAAPPATPEKENIVSPAGMPMAKGQALLKDLVNMILQRQEQQQQQRESRWLIALTIVFAWIYAILPEIMRVASGTYSKDAHGVAFFIITFSGMFTNFVIFAVVLDALSKSVTQLKFRVGIARSFTQLTSKTAASALGLFHFELQTIENLWGWLTLRSYLLRRGKRPQARVEIILSAAFAFLVPLALMLALDFFFSKTPITVFVISTFYFCFVMASFLLLCVWNGVLIQSIYRDQDVLLSEQLAIHYRICTTRDAELHHRLSNLHAAIAKIMEILNKSAGSGAVLSILGFSINENFSRVLIGGLLSLASAGVSSLLRFAPTVVV